MNVVTRNFKSLSRKQSGATTMELLFYLIVAALILYAAVQGGFKLFSRQSNNTEQENVASLIINTRALKGNTGYGTSGTNLVPVLSTTDGIPNGMTFTSGVPYNSWNGAVTVVSTGPSFTITYPTVPQDACVSLATRVAKNASITTKINSGTGVVGEISASSASTSCTDPTANIISWTVSS
ncbi:type 4 pilus major pilin [Pseudomonas sp. AB12(2023)]|uniref:type 4 pilus major pilin n=1 Tax=Pseudomonas sp. AB12(2023) TaxID=3048597 RepID=UPI002B22D342|nr:type 4 pilus major pilin [Pseudomonas sp. AB12(2023)]MEB0222040.1 type 4 pilus major pilin [Pseudomonas sp. AB12(2023)]